MHESDNDPSIWSQAIKSLLNAPFPSLMRVEFKNCRKLRWSSAKARELPKEVSGWKVTESDHGEIIAIERI